MHSLASAALPGETQPLEAPPRESISLEHDFGVLRPGQSAQHQFLIHNSSDAAWTIRRITNTCVCTATSLSAPKIEPGRVESVEVTYKAHGDSHDEHRAILIDFTEAHAPRVSLDVYARVRDPLSIFPRELLVNISAGGRREEAIEVHNFGDLDWTGLEVVPSAAWVSTESIPLPTPEQARRAWTARQAWRVLLKFDAAALTPGDHATELVIRAGSGDDTLVKTVPITARVASLVKASPVQFFFGSVPAGTTTTRQVTIQFAEGTELVDAAKVRLTHDLGGGLVVRWQATEGRFWQLTADLTPQPGATTIAGEVRVAFDGTDLADLVIPVQGLVEQAREQP